MTEGDGVTVNANFVLTLAGGGPEPAPYTVQYATSSGSAVGGASCTSGIDFINKTGTASLNANGTVPVAVQVCGDLLDEAGRDLQHHTLESNQLERSGWRSGRDRNHHRQ